MFLRFTIEIEKVLEALGKEYELPDIIDWIELENAEKDVYVATETGQAKAVTIEVEVRDQ